MKIQPEMTASPLFRGIAAGELEALLDCVEAAERRYGKGETVLHRGQPTARLGLVLSGAVHIVKEDFWGSRTIVGLAGPGEVFAESYACMETEPLEVAVVAVAPRTRVLFLSAARALSGCGRGCAFHTRLTENLVSLLAGKNLALTRKMGHMARRTTRDKVLSFLSAQALRAGGSAFDIPLDRQQLADYLAVDRSALSAVLSRLRDEGVLEFHKNHFRLLHPGQLEE